MAMKAVGELKRSKEHESYSLEHYNTVQSLKMGETMAWAGVG